MKLLCLISLLMIGLCCTAQQKSGINFAKGLTWMEVRQKAKRENKFIFLDAYTTWCLPCRYMAQYIFTQAQVGDFFNTRFINVAVQMNKTKKDNGSAKSWYTDAELLSDSYKIEAYPTYLFFNPDGTLVHRVVGGSKNAKDFIEIAKEAFDPKTQYQSLKTEYRNGKRDSVFLLSLINIAKNAQDDSLPVFINTYLHGQSNLLTKQNIDFIAMGTIKSSDIGFRVLLNYPKEVDSAGRKSERKKVLSKIIFDEQIYPLLCYNGEIKRLGGGMIIYRTDSLNRNVEWTKIEDSITFKYKAISARIILDARLNYYEWLDDWANFNHCLLNYTSNENDVDVGLIESYAGDFSTFCNDKQSFGEAIKWAAVLIKDTNPLYYLRTYSRMLYKGGESVLAIQYLEKYASLLKTTDESVSETLVKMRKNEEIE